MAINLNGTTGITTTGLTSLTASLDAGASDASQEV